MDAANEAAAPLFAAALAFATLFAVIPLILLVAGVIGWLVQDPVQREALLDQLVNLIPPLADLFEQTLDNLAQASGTLSIIGLIGLLWGSSSFYGALDEVMRRIFPGGGIRDPIVRRIRGVLAILILVGLGRREHRVWAPCGRSSTTACGILVCVRWLSPLIRLGRSRARRVGVLPGRADQAAELARGVAAGDRGRNRASDC